MESVDNLSDHPQETRPSIPDVTPDKFGDLAGQLQVLEDDEAVRAAENIVGGVTLSQVKSNKQSLILKEDTNSMPGSIVEESAEPINVNESPAAVVCEQENMSQHSEELQEVNVELVEEQGKGEGEMEAPIEP